MDLSEQIKSDINENPIILFMKGTKEMPMCGFSNQVVQILNHYGVIAFNCNPGTGYVVYGSNPGISSDKIRLISYQWKTYREYFNHGKIYSFLGIVINILNKLVKR